MRTHCTDQRDLDGDRARNGPRGAAVASRRAIWAPALCSWCRSRPWTLRSRAVVRRSVTGVPVAGRCVHTRVICALHSQDHSVVSPGGSSTGAWRRSPLGDLPPSTSLRRCREVSTPRRRRRSRDAGSFRRGPRRSSAVSARRDVLDAGEMSSTAQALGGRPPSGRYERSRDERGRCTWTL
jgi:hypothetical protein